LSKICAAPSSIIWILKVSAGLETCTGVFAHDLFTESGEPEDFVVDCDQNFGLAIG
jgi:hypothetical protein